MRKTNEIVLLGIFDVLVSIPFVASNWWIWDYLSGKITANVWGPLQIAIVPQIIAGGRASPVGIALPIPNFPFNLFWVALAGNFIFVILASEVIVRNSHQVNDNLYYLSLKQCGK